jgi:hypothetical protein
MLPSRSVGVVGYPDSARRWHLSLPNSQSILLPSRQPPGLCERQHCIDQPAQRSIFVVGIFRIGACFVCLPVIMPNELRLDGQPCGCEGRERHDPDQGAAAARDFFLEGGAMKFIEKSAIITCEYWVRVY